MKRSPRMRTKGMTLTELLITLITGVLITGIVLGSWYFAYKRWAVERIRTKLRIDLAVCMERIKEEMRLSSLTYTSFYPSDALSYTAINFPLSTPDEQGFLILDADWLIQWDKGVVYHVFENPADSGNFELRRTEFTNNNAYITNETSRQKQLEDLVQYGEAVASTPNNSNATTKVLLEKIEAFTISPQIQIFDGYSPTIRRSDKVEFGNIKLYYGEDGYHDFKFEVIGKNDSSSGFKLGIDTLSITPSGCQKEAETYYPLSSPHSHDGGNPSKVYMAGWSGDNYLEYSSGDIGDYINLHIYHDQWLESNFEGSSKDNTIRTGDDLYIKLRDLEEGNVIDWSAIVEAGSGSGNAIEEDYNNGLGTPISLAGKTIRNLISNANIEFNSDALRVEFHSHSANSLTIAEAYLDERNPSQQNDCINPPTSNSRIKLYFTDVFGNIAEGITLSPGSSVKSNWAIFPIDSTKDYFVTFYVSSGYISYWAGTQATDRNSYVTDGNAASLADWPDPTAHRSQPTAGTDETISSPDIYAQATLEIWSKTGEVISAIYDTTLDNPDFKSVGWTESQDADITVAVGSSDDSEMAGASWESGSDANPHTLSIGSGRYVQFEAVLSTIPYWTCIDHSSINVSDSDYKSGNTNCSSCGMYLMPQVNCPWIDNVAINWPGDERMYDISGYFTQKPDYGKIKLTIDGKELTKGLEFYLEISETLQGDLYQASLASEIEPRNTGR